MGGGGFLELLLSLLHILQIEDLQRPPAFSLTADQLVDLPEAAGVHQNHLGNNICIIKLVYLLFAARIHGRQ